MRSTSVLRILLGLQKTLVTGMTFEEGGLVLDVRPTTKKPRCGCGRKGGCHDSRERRWRHLDFGGMKVFLRYKIRRVNCRKCGVRVERVPWAEPGSWFTRPFEEQVAYLAQRCDRTTVETMMRIAWRTVGDIVRRVVAAHRGHPSRWLDDLTHIGIDELSYRRHHEYITIVTDHRTGRVVWAGRGKSTEAALEFFAALGPQRCAKLENVTMDMSAAFKKAVEQAAPQAEIVFDRFHVQRLAHDALDELRRSVVRELEDPEERKALKGTRWSLQKNPWNLTRLDADRLSAVRRDNEPLYRGYLLKETLRAILDRRQHNVARVKLEEWCDWASRSRLAPFQRVAKTIRAHLDGIVAYVRTRLNNGIVEGLNGKARTITRRAYGFHCAQALISMLFLCCGGIHLEPAHITPFQGH